MVSLWPPSIDGCAPWHCTQRSVFRLAPFYFCRLPPHRKEMSSVYGGATDSPLPAFNEHHREIFVPCSFAVSAHESIQLIPQVRAKRILREEMGPYDMFCSFQIWQMSRRILESQVVCWEQHPETSSNLQTRSFADKVAKLYFGGRYWTVGCRARHQFRLLIFVAFHVCVLRRR